MDGHAYIRTCERTANAKVEEGGGREGGREVRLKRGERRDGTETDQIRLDQRGQEQEHMHACMQ